MNNKYLKLLLSKFARYFIQGAILVIPITLTIYIVYNAISFVDHLLPVHYPGLNLIIIITTITLLGAFGSTIILQPFINYFERMMEKAPLVKVIYTSLKDLLSAFVGKEKKFNQPVLVKINGTDEIMRLGFITQEDLTFIGIEDRFVAVYFPHSYNFSGNLLIVPRKNVIKVSGPSAEVMKFIVSGGVTDLDHIKIKS
jgi:uncharacterized membrane protein